MEKKALLMLSVFAVSLFCASMAGAATTTYIYDELNRLTQVNYDDGAIIIYSYDELGNRTQTTTNDKDMVISSFAASPTTGVFPLTVNFTDASTGSITSRQWNFGDGSAISTQQNPTYVYNNAGTYSVTLTVSNVAGSNTMAKIAYITVQQCPGSNHVQIAGKGGYAKLQDAYNAASSGDTIQAQTQITFSENLIANRSISVTLAGGYSCDYATNPGTTKLQGMLTTSSGMLTIKDFVLSN